MNQLEQFDQVVTVDVDPQIDFMPGGKLGVAGGFDIIDPLNEVNGWTRDENGFVIFTGDAHPRNTKHFAKYGGPWVEHCLRYTAGAAFPDNLIIEPGDTVAYKGMGTEDDGYSGWEAQFDFESPLYEEGQALFGGGGLTSEAIDTVGRAVENMALRRKQRVALIIGGLATDYCVKATVMDALQNAERLQEHYNARIGIFVVENAIRAVDVEPGDGDRAIAEMKEAGAQFVTSDQLINGQVLEVVR